MAEQWFYEVQGESRGPVDRTTLTRLAQDGTIHRSSLVWTEGFPDWKPASTVEGLFVGPPPLHPKTPEPPPLPRAAGQGGRERQGSGRGVLDGLGARLRGMADLPSLSSVPVREILIGGLKRETKTEDIEQIFAAGTTDTTPAPREIQSGWPIPRVFWRVLGGSVATYFLLRLGWTEFQNANFLPGMIFVGSFVVPLCVVVLFLELNTPRNVSVYQTTKMLLLGGALSLIATMIVFQFVTGAGTGRLVPAMLTGIGEELGKALALLVLVRSPRYPWQMNGLLFGAAVGAGFAGFESAGYAFNTGLTASVSARFVVQPALDNIMLRAILSPGGHVIWTAMVGSAIWKVKGDRPFQMNMLIHPLVVRRWLIAVVLHGIWDTHIAWLDWRLKLGALILVGWYVIFAILKQALAEIEAAKQGAPAQTPPLTG